MAYYFKKFCLHEKFDVPAILSEVIISVFFFFFFNEPKGFLELGQNPSNHLRLNNNNNSLTCKIVNI